MNELKTKGNLLSDDDLATVSGGVAEEGTAVQKRCPICNSRVTYSRNTRLDGSNITLYKCANCRREFSLLQIKKTEDLSTDYTGKGDDSFGL